MNMNHCEPKTEQCFSPAIFNNWEPSSLHHANYLAYIHIRRCAVSYGETARVVILLAIRNITHYNTDQYQNWDELWLYLPPK